MLWRRVEALCVFVVLMYLMLRVYEWNSYVLLGAFPHRVLDPLSLNVRKLRSLLDRRGMLFGGVFEKAELAVLVRDSGGVTMIETEDAERMAIKSNSSLLPESAQEEENVVTFTGADHFNEQVEDCKDSIWLVQVVAANGRSPVMSTIWRQLIAKLEPFGVRFGIYNCRGDMSSVRRRLFRRLRRLRKKEKTDLGGDASTAKGSSVQAEDDADMMVMDDSSPSLSFEEAFPLPLALAIVFLYIGVCAALFRYWETDWDYFTAVYFVFISLSTVGLGDEMPAHPHYACGFFFFFLIGLALVSMCVSVMQMRYEARYMAALQLIDEEAQESGGVITVIPQQVVPGLVPSLPATVGDSTAIRWRPPLSLDVPPQTPNSDLDSPRTPLFTRRQPSFSPSGGSAAAPPAVLGVLMARRRSTMRGVRGSSSGQSGSVSGDECGSTDRLSQPQISPQAAGNGGEPSRPTRTSVVGVPLLSVITEATDDDKAHRPAAGKVDKVSPRGATSGDLSHRPTRSSAVGLSVITEAGDEDRRSQRSAQLHLRRESSVDIADEEASGETASNNTSSTNDAS